MDTLKELDSVIQLRIKLDASVCVVQAALHLRITRKDEIHASEKQFVVSYFNVPHADRWKNFDHHFQHLKRLNGPPFN